MPQSWNKKKHKKKGFPLVEANKKEWKGSIEMPDNVKLFNNPYELKMSAVLGEFAEPFMSEINKIEDFKVRIAIAVLIWNYSITRHTDPSDMEKEELIATITKSGGDRAKTEDLVDMMLDRKERLFPGNDRLILDFHAEERNNEFGLKVIAELDN